MFKMLTNHYGKLNLCTHESWFLCLNDFTYFYVSLVGSLTQNIFKNSFSKFVIFQITLSICDISL